MERRNKTEGMKLMKNNYHLHDDIFGMSSTIAALRTRTKGVKKGKKNTQTFYTFCGCCLPLDCIARCEGVIVIVLQVPKIEWKQTNKSIEIISTWFILNITFKESIYSLAFRMNEQTHFYIIFYAFWLLCFWNAIFCDNQNATVQNAIRSIWVELRKFDATPHEVQQCESKLIRMKEVLQCCSFFLIRIFVPYAMTTTRLVVTNCGMQKYP